MGVARDGERLARESAFTCEKRRDGLADTRGLWIRYKQAKVVAELAERFLPLEGCQRVREHGGTPGIERVDREGVAPKLAFMQPFGCVAWAGRA
jgi:hypothetical protein